MKKRMKLKIKSKKGVTLLELLVGITIVVIVFSSTLGAMVGGFTTTVHNSDENRASVLNASVNEIIFNSIRKMKISDYDEAVEFIEEVEAVGNSTPGPEDDTYAYALSAAVFSALKSPILTEEIPDVQFVVPVFNSETGNYEANFADGVSYQYSLIPSKNKQISSVTATGEGYDIDGITVKTCFESASGPIIYESFVAFSK